MAGEPRRKTFEYSSHLKWTAQRKGVLDFGKDKPSLEVATAHPFTS